MIPLSEITPLKGSWGQDVVGIWQVYPWMSNFITEAEKNWSGEWINQTVVTPVEPFVLPIVGFYLFLNLWFIPKMMKDRKPFDLKMPLAAWNFFLSAFSFMGCIRVLPYLYYYQTQVYSFRDISCTSPRLTGMDLDIGFWVWVFGASKFFELFDTVFISLRKRPLIFLHWYHHVTVLLFCYYAGIYEHAGLYFVGMNYFVHAWMYLYYGLMAFKMVPSWFPPQILTALQISQMAVGCITGYASMYYKLYDNKPCEGVSETLLYMGLVMYSSYFYLFGEFAYKRFYLGPKKAAYKARKKAEAAAATAPTSPVSKKEQ